MNLLKIAFSQQRNNTLCLKQQMILYSESIDMMKSYLALEERNEYCDMAWNENREGER